VSAAKDTVSLVWGGQTFEFYPVSC